MLLPDVEGGLKFMLVLVRKGPCNEYIENITYKNVLNRSRYIKKLMFAAIFVHGGGLNEPSDLRR